jgi:hypothetical protein
MHRAVHAISAAPRTKSTNYPAPFAARMAGRVKRPLGDRFGLQNFGVNLTTIAPGGISALFHRHSRQDEFIYMLEGELVLVTDNGERTCNRACVLDLRPGARGIISSTGRTKTPAIWRSGIEARVTRSVIRLTIFERCSERIGDGSSRTKMARLTDGEALATAMSP